MLNVLSILILLSGAAAALAGEPENLGEVVGSPLELDLDGDGKADLVTLNSVYGLEIRLGSGASFRNSRLACPGTGSAGDIVTCQLIAGTLPNTFRYLVEVNGFEAHRRSASRNLTFQWLQGKILLGDWSQESWSYARQGEADLGKSCNWKSGWLTLRISNEYSHSSSSPEAKPNWITRRSTYLLNTILVEDLEPVKAFESFCRAL